jgi:hypothetical protein
MRIFAMIAPILLLLSGCQTPVPPMNAGYISDIAYDLAPSAVYTVYLHNTILTL